MQWPRVMETALALLALSGVAGAGVFLETRYANREATAEQLAEVSLQYQQLREDALARRIFELEAEKDQRRGRLPQFMEQELQRLKEEQRQTKERIDKLLKK